jgi:lipoate---protein ligase
MALDAWLFEQHRLGLHPPTLRFYTWEPIALSLGYHQHHYPDAWQHLVWQGRSLDLIRRPTGGRAVLHQGDLTYAVIASGFAGSRMQAYQTICEFLIQGWRSLGIKLGYGTAGRGYIHNPHCFGTATGADLVMPDGTKLIGSAQLRQGSALLQHGSMRLTSDRLLFQQVFGTETALGDRLPELNIQTLVDALLTAASQCFSTRFIAQPLSETEWQAVMVNAARFLVLEPHDLRLDER